MKHIQTLLTSLVLTLTLSGCEQKLPADIEIPILTSQEVAQLNASNEGPILLDVRTPKEFEKGRIPGSLNIPHKQLERRVAEISSNRERDIIVYCEKGGRARYAIGVLSKLGFQNLALVEGDMGEWRKNGLPVER